MNDASGSWCEPPTSSTLAANAYDWEKQIMRKLRAAVAGTLAVGLMAAVGSGGPASAAATGVGTAEVSTSLLKVSLGNSGSLLSARLLGDDSRSTIDPSVSAPAASTKFVPLQLSSAAVPALNATVGAVESTSTGPQTVQSSPVVDLTTAATTGSVSPFSIVSQVDSGSARSLLDTSAANVSVAGGLLQVPSVSSALDTTAAADRARGLRGVNVPSVTVLDLSAVLEGLGVRLTDLPVETLTSLLTTLNLEVPGIGSGSTLQDAVDDLNAAIDDVQELLAGTPGTVDQVLDLLDPVAGLVDTDPIEDVGSDATAAANAALDELQATLADLLGDALQTLDDAVLLKVTGIEVGVAATAADTTGNSAAAVSAKLGGLQVGNVGLPGVDLGATATQLASTVDSVESKVGGVLDDVHPGLGNLIDVTLFDKKTDVSSDQKYVTASASLTAVTVKIAPPLDLAAIVGQLVAGTGVDEVLADLGVGTASSGGVAAASVVDGNTPMSALNTALGGAEALAAGAEVKVMDFSATSRFAAAGAAPTPPGAPAGELPRTGGGPGMPFAVFGAALLAAALLLVRWLRIPSTVR
jgi:hypothetical protein